MIRVKPEFRSFRTLLQAGKATPLPPYLSLLSLAPGAETEAALVSVREAVRKCADPATAVEALLSDVNWRLHVIGAIALTQMEPSARCFDPLWRALDCGSGGAAQLATVASLLDPRFDEQARLRIESGGATDREMIAERVSAQLQRIYFPDRFGPYSVRSLVALVTLCRERTPRPAWLSGLLCDPVIEERMAEDWERTEAVTRTFRANAERVLLPVAA